jgi:hypothetical protein
MADRFAAEFANEVMSKLRPELQALANGGSGNGGSSGNGRRNASVRIQPRLLNAGQASVYVCRSLSALHKLVHRGEIPCVKHGKRLRNPS